MDKKVILLDGASGTRLWELAAERDIPAEPVWKYNLSHPELVIQVGREYAEAGSEILYSNTFTASGPAVRHASDYDPAEVVRAGVRTAREAAAGRARVALDIGPLSTLLKPYGTLTEEEAVEIFSAQLAAGMEEKPDLIVLETFMDLRMLELAARLAAEYPVPMLCTMSFGKRGRTNMGDRVETVVERLKPYAPAGLGINCSLGPTDALPVLRQFAAATDIPLVFKPNAGLPVTGPDGAVTAPYDAGRFAEECVPALTLAGYVGACCGSDSGYIRALKNKLKEI